MNKLFEPPAIAPSSGLNGGRLFKFKQLPSTNDWGMEHLDELKHGDVVYTDNQTAGKGRNFRSWESGEEGNVAMSIVLDWPDPPELISMTGQAAALAVRELLADYSISALLKWPNDVLVHDRKIAGILSESKSSIRKIVLGIGLNINLTEELIESWQLEQAATSMRIETGNIYNPAIIVSGLIDRLTDSLNRLENDGAGHLLQQWKATDWLSGGKIEVRDKISVSRGDYAGLDEFGRLVMEDEDGETRVFWSGDVRRVRKI